MPDPVVLTGVTKEFRAGDGEPRRAVDRVTLSVREGEILLIAGPNGSGKTTLLTLIGCMARPTGGSVALFGEEVAGLSRTRLAGLRLRRIGFVFQTFRLLECLTVAENVALLPQLAGAERTAIRERTAEALELVGMHDKRARMPRGLSSGEKQRVAIARAIVNDPPLILADEPTGSLDAAGGQAAIDLLRSIARRQGTTVIIVSHDERIRRHADRVLRMEDGALRDPG